MDYEKILYFIPLLLLFISCQTTEYITNSINTDEPLKNSFVSKLNPNKSISGDDIISKIKKEARLNNEELYWSFMSKFPPRNTFLTR